MYMHVQYAYSDLVRSFDNVLAHIYRNPIDNVRKFSTHECR